MRRAVMRCAVLPLLLSACTAVPQDPSGLDYSAGPIPGYAQGLATAGGAPCLYPGSPSFMGPPYGTQYGSSFNCATPLGFYARNAYVPYYFTPAPMVVTHPRRTHTPGTPHKSSGHHGKRK